ncbi:SPOR domain-containing protein [Thermus sediminis]|uniref:SPOR domain-containing protein n=1 Tax=Thermus sediminis TaxID=1761908 RepID=UPI000E3D2BB6|nr:SPOR domain-containing protein [Thermus sediminis]
MRWFRENWLDALIFLLIALVAAGIVLYLIGINPFARPQAAPPPPPASQPLPVPPQEARPPEPVVTVIPLPQAPLERPQEAPPEPRPQEVSPARPRAEAPPMTPRSGGSYRVAVGAFANPENALRLSRELSQKGYPVRLEAAGNLTRVVVGPYASEPEARQVAEALQAYGAQVYRGQGPPPPAGGSLYLQVGAFQREENALALAGRLREMGLPVVLARDGFYRVRVGPVSPEERESVEARLAALGLTALEVP